MTEKILYAQPFANSSIDSEKLKKGIYYPNQTGLFYITDIGDLLYRLCRSKDSDAKIEIIEQNLFIGSAINWEVRMSTEKLEIDLVSKIYNHGLEGGQDPRNKGLKITFNGGHNEIDEYVKELNRLSLKPPYEIDNWKKFSKKFGVSKEEVIDGWMEYLAKTNKEAQTLKNKNNIDKESCEVTLFAQPTASVSLIDSKLQKGIYFPEQHGLFFMSDTADLIWRTCNSMDKDSKIKILNQDSKLTGNSTLNWETEIDISGLLINIQSKYYSSSGWKGPGEPKNRALKIHFKGDKEKTDYIINDLIHLSLKPPYEINNWKKFTKVFGVTKEEVLEGWKPYIE